MDLSRPGKPTDNALVKSFNGSLRDECLNVHWFLSLEDAQEKIEGWRHRAWRTAMARKSLPRAAGLNIAGFNGGIALGSILGGIALEITGLVSTAWVGACVVVLGIVWMLFQMLGVKSKRAVVL